MFLLTEFFRLPLVNFANPSIAYFSICRETDTFGASSEEGSLDLVIY
jgi:hypothetical protein